jgi:hypothetical protein
MKKFNVGDIVIPTKEFRGGPGWDDYMKNYIGKPGIISTVYERESWVTVHGWTWIETSLTPVDQLVEFEHNL